MKPLKSNEIVGTWATVLLPIREDESIDWGVLEEEIAFLASTGVNGIYSNGTAGEFYTQTEAEFDRVSALVAEYCERAGMPFQIGVCHMSAEVSLSRLKRAVELHPSAVQVILPDWYPVTNEEAIAFLTRVASAAKPIPLVLYNPPHAKRVLSPLDFGELARAVPELVGIKVANGDEHWYEQMRKEASRLSFFVPGHHLASGLGLGASGSYSNVACINPRGAVRWFEMMQTNRNKALDLERRIIQFIKLIPPDYPNAAKDKFLAAIGGWGRIGTRLRWPYRWIPESVVDSLRPRAKELMPELFEE